MTMTKLSLTSVLFASVVSAYAAGDMKNEGADGEPKAATSKIQIQKPKQKVGLLLPAIQSAREAAHRPNKDTQNKAKKGKVETEWKVEKGE